MRRRDRTASPVPRGGPPQGCKAARKAGREQALSPDRGWGAWGSVLLRAPYPPVFSSLTGSGARSRPSV
jgi:hypothetical protein